MVKFRETVVGEFRRQFGEDEANRVLGEMQADIDSGVQQVFEQATADLLATIEATQANLRHVIERLDRFIADTPQPGGVGTPEDLGGG